MKKFSLNSFLFFSPGGGGGKAYPPAIIKQSRWLVDYKIIFCLDDEIIVKTVSHKESKFLQEILPAYYLNLHQNFRKGFIILFFFTKN